MYDFRSSKNRRTDELFQSGVCKERLGIVPTDPMRRKLFGDKADSSVSREFLTRTSDVG